MSNKDGGETMHIGKLFKKIAAEAASFITVMLLVSGKPVLAAEELPPADERTQTIVAIISVVLATVCMVVFMIAKYKYDMRAEEEKKLRQEAKKRMLEEKYGGQKQPQDRSGSAVGKTESEKSPEAD